MHRHIRQPDEECQAADRDEQALAEFKALLSATRAAAYHQARKHSRALRFLGWVCCPAGKADRPDPGVGTATGPNLRLRGLP